MTDEEWEADFEHDEDGRETGDMGPFAGMDPQLQQAITNYGTPPFRKLVKVEVVNIDQREFEDTPTTLGDWISWLEAVRSRIPAEYLGAHRCLLRYEPPYYDSGDRSELVVSYKRPETDEEMIERVNGGIAYVQNKDAAERAQFEALKQKFGQ